MANHKKEERKATTVQISLPNKEKLERMVEEQQISGSDIINKLIKRAK